jgi:phage terminase large subunit GpA-like protein
MTEDELRLQAKSYYPAPPALSVTQWADKYRRLSEESSAEPGKYRSARTPYVKGIMDALNDPSVREVWWMKSAQVGATEILNNMVGYFIHWDASTIIVMHPTVDMGHAWSKDRLSPMIRDTPVLAAKVRIGNTKDGSSTLLHKQFAGGALSIVGANSAASLASRPIRIVLCDEVDRYPASAGDEGDPVNLVKVRSTTFWNRKFFAASTPTIKDVSRIEKGFLSGDQRRFLVPCVHCGHKQALRWEQLDFRGEGTELEPVYRCEECGGLHKEHHKAAMLNKGEWEAQSEFNGVASFHINALYSPWKSWGSVVLDFLNAKRGGPEMIKTWKNTMLGETYEESGEVVSSEALAARAEVGSNPDAHIAPDEVLFATWGADVQGDRVEIHLIGWGDGEKAFCLDYVICNGSPDNPLTWQRVDDFLDAKWKTVSGRSVPVPVGGIDTGDGNTQQAVLDWVRPRMGNRRGVLPFKGSTVFNAEIYTPPRKLKRGETGTMPWMIGVSQAKLVIYDRLKLTDPDAAGYFHFPAHYDEIFFRSLTAEKLMTKYHKGFPKKEWHKIRERNEALDTTVYAYAAMKILNPDWDKLAVSSETERKPKPAPTKRAKLARKRPKMRLKL